ncbi:hypothetical protein V475_20385 [Sphingobium baderi LL03]|nr:hypothetical protein V475_20385 [Sphingobium baderi LL03]
MGVIIAVEAGCDAPGRLRTDRRRQYGFGEHVAVTDTNDRWCILRMSGISTIPVATALTDAGFTVWTPTVTEECRVGKARERRERSVSLTPGIVFAKDDRLHDLAVMARSPALTFQRWNPETKRMERKGCPPFAVFRYQGQFPRINDRHLDPLRQAEQRAQPRDRGPHFNAGDEVRIPSAAFGGLSCVVDEVQSRFAVVRLSGSMGEMRIRVEMCDLLPAKTAA